jgi:hypothetical protein
MNSNQRLKRIPSYDGSDIWVCARCFRKPEECQCPSEAKGPECIGSAESASNPCPAHPRYKLTDEFGGDFLPGACCFCGKTDPHCACGVPVKDTREERDLYQLRREMIGHRTFIEKRDAETIARVADIEEELRLHVQALDGLRERLDKAERFNVPYGVAGTSDRGPMVDAGIKECTQAELRSFLCEIGIKADPWQQDELFRKLRERQER